MEECSDIKINSSFSNSVSHSQGQIEPNPQAIPIKQEFNKFFQSNSAYMSLSENSKMLVFNCDLSVKESIDAMIREEIYCGVIWNTEVSKFSAVFTLRDFLKILIVTYDKIVKLCMLGTVWQDTKHLSRLVFQKSTIQIEELDIIMENVNSFNNSEVDNMDENMSGNFNINSPTNTNNVNIANTIDMTQFHKKMRSYKDYFEIFSFMSLADYLIELENNIELRQPISVDLDAKLDEILLLMLENKIHRIVVEDGKTNQYTAILTFETIIEYFMINYYSNMDIFSLNYKTLQIPNSGIIFAYADETIYTCFYKIWEHKVSILPILKDKEKENIAGVKSLEIIGFIFLKDLIYFYLASEKFRFDASIMSFLEDLYSDVNQELPYGQDRLAFIEENENLSFKEFLERIYQSPEKKIVVYNEKITNISKLITLSDLFKSTIC